MVCIPRRSNWCPPSVTRALLRLDKIASEFPGIQIYAKAEYSNPGGSVKDRAGLNMILDGERSGRSIPIG